MNRDILLLTIIVLRQHSKCVLFPRDGKTIIAPVEVAECRERKSLINESGRTDGRMVGARDTTSYRATELLQSVRVKVKNKAYSCRTPVMFAGR